MANIIGKLKLLDKLIPIKFVDNGDGSYSINVSGSIASAVAQLPAALGQATMANSLAVTVASDQSAINIATKSEKIIVTPVVTASSAYASGNCIGGKLTLTNAMRVVGGTGVLQSLTIIDRSNQKPNLDILTFGQDPATGTYTDKTALTVHATDIPYIAGRISIGSSDWVTVGGVSVAVVVIGRVIKETSGASRNLFALVNTTSTPTFSSVGDLTFKFGFLWD